MARKVWSTFVIGLSTVLVLVASMLAAGFIYKDHQWRNLDIYDLAFYIEYSDLDTFTAYAQDAKLYFVLGGVLFVLGLIPMIDWWRGRVLALRVWKRPIQIDTATLIRRVRLPYALILFLTMALLVGNQWGLGAFLKAKGGDSDFIRRTYVDPNTERFEFPGKKRNLIWIFLESVEVTMFTKDAGGDYNTTVIPQLQQLAQDPANITITGQSTLAGSRQLIGTSFSIGGITAQTGGVPLIPRLGIAGNDYGYVGDFMPGTHALSDVLAGMGYQQMVIMGAEAGFGGLNKFYQRHGNVEVLDRQVAIDRGIVGPEYVDHPSWLGFPDETLYWWAKTELDKLAKSDQPFSLTLETADTHPPGSMLAANCPAAHPEHMDNVLACTSKQVVEFLDWLKTQPYYADTTVVITGDHLMMSDSYMAKYLTGGHDYRRSIYNVIVNSAISVPPERLTNRKFSAVDFYPTVVAALGMTDPPKQLGWGVNLLSGEDTLSEKYGPETFFNNMQQDSHFYDSEILGLVPK